MPSKRSSKHIIWGDDLVLTSPPATCRRRNQQIERQEQTAYFECIDWDVDAGKLGANCIFAIPNETGIGGRSGLKIGADRKRTGRRKGVPDIVVAVPMFGCPGMYIEMKRPRAFGGRPGDVSKEQRDWHERLRQQGYKVEVSFGWIDAYDATASYLGWKRIDRASAQGRATDLAGDDNDDSSARNDNAGD